MEKTISEVWFEPAYQMLEGFEESLKKLDESVEKEIVDDIKKYSLIAAQYSVRLGENDIIYNTEDIANVYLFSEVDKQEYMIEEQKYFERCDVIFKKAEEINEKIKGKLLVKTIKKGFSGSEENIDKIIKEGYAPTTAYIKLIEEVIKPRTKKKHTKEKYEKSFGKNISKELDETSNTGYV